MMRLPHHQRYPSYTAHSQQSMTLHLPGVLFPSCTDLVCANLPHKNAQLDIEYMPCCFCDGRNFQLSNYGIVPIQAEKISQAHTHCCSCLQQTCLSVDSCILGCMLRMFCCPHPKSSQQSMARSWPGHQARNCQRCKAGKCLCLHQKSDQQGRARTGPFPLSQNTIQLHTMCTLLDQRLRTSPLHICWPPCDFYWCCLHKSDRPGTVYKFCCLCQSSSRHYTVYNAPGHPMRTSPQGMACMHICPHQKSYQQDKAHTGPSPLSQNMCQLHNHCTLLDQLLRRSLPCTRCSPCEHHSCCRRRNARPGTGNIPHLPRSRKSPENNQNRTLGPFPRIGQRCRPTGRYACPFKCVQYT